MVQRIGPLPVKNIDELVRQTGYLMDAKGGAILLYDNAGVLRMSIELEREKQTDRKGYKENKR